MDKNGILQLLEHIDPVALDYNQWLAVGQALHYEGFTVDVWDAWSTRDTVRYHPRECERKWDGFGSYSTATPVTGGTLYHMALEQGYTPEGNDTVLDWNDIIGRDDEPVIDRKWLERRELPEMREAFNPVKQLSTYLSLLFEASETVGYVTEVYEHEGRYAPTKGVWSRTAGEIIEALSKCNGDIEQAIGTCNEDAGAWIRFNPLDGKGVKNENVTDFRYALVESDKTDIDTQYTLMKELELPIVVMVHSGGKSLHAICRIDAASYEEYRKRVDYLYNVCAKNGLAVDSQNRNPSRLSRMPGVTRNGKPQYIVETNIGQKSFTEWQEYIEGINDSLPDPENLSEVWDDLPPLAPALIDGVLRQGHKMLLAGPSKAGKSFALLELCIAIAEGTQWLGFQCARGRVLYVNLEVDRASCLHRIKDVYTALGIVPNHIADLDVWNLRGNATPLDKLAPKLIRRALKKNYIAVVIDPIYKIITGDENSADQMAAFCGQFDKICNELGCAVIYCHHHSKGAQGQKRSMDRASGSGVFARDPDAMLDLVEIIPDEDDLQALADRFARDRAIEYLERFAPSVRERLTEQDMASHVVILARCASALPADQYEQLLTDVAARRATLQNLSAWRVEGTLREFASFPPINCWFDYPRHVLDETGILCGADAESDRPVYQRGADARKRQARKERDKQDHELENAIEAANMGQPPTIKDLASYMDLTEHTTRARLKRHGGYFIDKNNGNVVIKKPDDEEDYS